MKMADKPMTPEEIEAASLALRLAKSERGLTDFAKEVIAVTERFIATVRDREAEIERLRDVCVQEDGTRIDWYSTAQALELLKEQAEAKNTRLREALDWYAEIATSIHRYWNADPPKDDAMLACITCITTLNLDNGEHARKAALTPAENADDIQD